MAGKESSKKRKALSTEPKGAQKPKATKIAKTISTKVSKSSSSSNDRATKSKSILKKTKQPTPSELAAQAEDHEDHDLTFEEDDEEDDQTAALLKGFGSSSEDDDEDQATTTPHAALPVPAAPTDVTAALAANDAPPNASGDRVVYVGRIPHGFYEHQMKAYFSQFGTISRLRLARNRRTGSPKHFAFLEFADAEVARIVADTMDSYLMFGHILKVKLIPREKVHEELWKGEGRRFRKVPWKAIERNRLRSADRESWGRRIGTEEKRRLAKAEKLKALGYEFDMPEMQSVGSVPIQMMPEVIEPIKTITDGDAAVVEDTGVKAAVDLAVKDAKAIKTAAKEPNTISRDGAKTSKKSKRIKQTV